MSVNPDSCQMAHRLFLFMGGNEDCSLGNSYQHSPMLKHSAPTQKEQSFSKLPFYLINYLLAKHLFKFTGKVINRHGFINFIHRIRQSILTCSLFTCSSRLSSFLLISSFCSCESTRGTTSAFCASPFASSSCLSSCDSVLCSSTNERNRDLTSYHSWSSQLW